MTDELKEIYSNHNNTEQFYECLNLVHDTLTYDIVNSSENITKNSVEYTAVPFHIVIPTAGDIKQDLQVSVDASDPQIMAFAENISESDAPFFLTLRVFRENSDDNQIPSLTLNITSSTLDKNIMTFTATRVDLLARKFPAGVNNSYDQRFTGLFL